MGDGRFLNRFKEAELPWRWVAFAALLALLSSGVAFLSEVDFRHYNADLLYLPTLFLDIRHWGGSFLEWRLTPAPYFFPDMLLFFPLGLLTPNIHLALFFYGLVQVTIFLSVVSLAGSALFPAAERRLYFLFVLLAFALWLTLRQHLVWQPVFTPSEHFGVTLFAPFLYWLTVKGFLPPAAERQKRGWVILFVISSGLIILSDQLALVQLTLPLLVGAGLLFLLHRMRKNEVVALLGAVLGGILLARLGDSVLIRYWVPAQLDIDKVLERSGFALTALLETMRGLWFADQRPVLLILAAAVGVHTAVCLIAIYRAAGQRDFSREWLLYSSFFGGMMLFSTVGIVGTGNFRDSGSLRYIYPLTILPIFSLLPFIYIAVRRTRLVRWGMLALALLLIIRHAGAAGRVGELSRYADFYPAWVACVDEQLEMRGVQYGVSGYWDAKYVSALSKRGTRLMAVYPDWTPHVKITNPEWYGRFPPQFVLYNPEESSNFGPLDMGRLINFYGYPHEVFSCGVREVWLYNQPEQQLFSRAFAAHPVTRNWLPDGVTERFPAFALRGDAAVDIAGTRIVADNVGGQIIAGYLPLMPPGTYQFVVDYAYEGAAVGEVGLLRVGQPVAGEIIWQEQPLLGNTAVGEQSISIQDANIFLQISFTGDGIMRVEQITITKTN
jgi:hypothetical protein